jgi:hypothetical protein
MWYYIVKILITSLIIVAVAEIAKRSNFWAAALASLPLTSLLAFVWLYLDTGEVDRVASLSQSIFWLVIPSLPFFLLMTAMLRAGTGFWLSLAVSCGFTIIAYVTVVWILVKAGIRV